MTRISMLLTTVGIAAVAAAAPASATIVLVDASSIQGDNVLFNTGVQTGTTVTGSTLGGNAIAFTGSTVGGGNIIRAQGGQARLEGALNTATRNPNDTLALSSLNFALVGGGTFNDLEFNLFGEGATAVTFALTDNQGEVFNFVQALGNGQNRFGFQGIDGESIASVSLSFNGTGVGDVRQIRLTETPAAPAVPEPATWAMMLVGFGFVGYGMRGRRVIATLA
ncbi:PEPxxWA-CTERM sorting domain-containing protein [Sphingomonas quercus]|nr:PEPxxWA-CTERM sorting domain-containing protein [Sphingomonas quercus]